MKPFDLEKALAGEPVVTRNGRPVKIAGYNEGLGSLIGWVDDRPKEWDKDGIWNTIFEIGGKNDLFMAEKPKVKKEGWVALDSTKDALVSFKIFDNPFRDSSGIFSNCRWAKIEWEEEV